MVTFKDTGTHRLKLRAEIVESGLPCAAAAGMRIGGFGGGGGGNDGEETLLNVAFLPVSVLKFVSRSAPFKLMALEPYLAGDYVKHNDNTGRVETTQEVPQAFSHFSFDARPHLTLPPPPLSCLGPPYIIPLPFSAA